MFGTDGMTRPSHPPPLFAFEHEGRTYRIELVPGSPHEAVSPGRSFWRARRGPDDMLVTPYLADETREQLEARLAAMLGT